MFRDETATRHTQIDKHPAFLARIRSEPMRGMSLGKRSDFFAAHSGGDDAFGLRAWISFASTRPATGFGADG